MSRQTRYAITDQIKQVAQMLNLPVENVLKRAGLPADFCDLPNAAVTSEKFFDLWRAMEAEANRPDLALTLALSYAHGPFAAPLFAFSSSENILAGLTRLSEFKPLLGPFALDVQRREDAVTLTFRSEAGQTVPATLSLFELIYIVECARTYTAEHIVPLVATSPAALKVDQAILDHLGVKVTEAAETQLVFALTDALRPLITRNDTLWESLEPGLRERLHAQRAAPSMQARVKRVLLETLAGGTTTSEEVARRLHTSKRSLQRRLTEEGVTFKDVLAETRLEMSGHYLAQSNISLAEIAYLLGFQDPTSFFRAYQSWTGRTPTEHRRELITTV